MIEEHLKSRPLDLVLLKTFVQVIDSQGFTSAADELHLAQSTISAHIKRLETQVGTSIIEKGQRTPVPTSVGLKLLVHARRLLSQNALAWQDIFEQRLEGVVRLGIPDDYLVYMPSVLSEFERRFPDVELQVYCGLSVELLDHMQSKMLDLAITTRQPNSPGGEVLCQERTVWVGAKDLDIQKRNPLPLAVSKDGLCIFRQRGIEALNSAGIPWRIAYTSASLSGLTAAVKAGLAVTILTPSMLTTGMSVLTASNGMPSLPMTEIALHIQPQAETNEATKRLADGIRKHIRSSVK
ncbi:LysR family transcriptional regulator [Vibrio sp. CAIM 722]|uniref:LysR family transcriptional regulator n=1 Tax=Vibrio eleionomae TaxID=2653505 RepID=A0A7X4LMV6_9VIBR|nr:LysR substrate-binding domain-containing protein [Vibrio eleionomae]MZI94715.1 LysR family transcriptional regulator [Vibrio eleionomae]